MRNTVETQKNVPGPGLGIESRGAWSVHGSLLLDMFTYVYIYLFIYLFIYLCIYLFMCIMYFYLFIEGCLEVKLPTIWTDEKQRWAESESQRREEKKKEGQKRASLRRKKTQDNPGARKGRKVAKHSVFPMICGSGGSKSRLAKAAGAEPAGQMRDEKLHAVVARSTFASEKARNTSRSEHF